MLRVLSPRLLRLAYFAAFLTSNLHWPCQAIELSTSVNSFPYPSTLKKEEEDSSETLIIYLPDYTTSHSNGSYFTYWQPSGSQTYTHTVVSTRQVGFDYVTREMKDETFLGNLKTPFQFSKLQSIKMGMYMNCERQHLKAARNGLLKDKRNSPVDKDAERRCSPSAYPHEHPTCSMEDSNSINLLKPSGFFTYYQV